MKVYMLPGKSDLGIGRVVDAYHKYMPAYDIEFVDKEVDADIISCHAGEHAGRHLDIHHCHGLYPTATVDKAKAFSNMNADVIENARLAHIMTVPSEWVADIFRRDMRLSPIVLRHGIDVSEWKSNLVGNYILWAKGHGAGVCDPSVLAQLSGKLRSGQQIVATFGAPSNNVKIIGKLPFQQMKNVIEGAGIYLATSRETFGIQTLEAMACGVPIVGYDWCGTADLVSHRYNGWLVKPGDVDGLLEGIEWINANRTSVGKNCIEHAKAYDWPTVTAEVADVYNKALSYDDGSDLDVSIVIPCYNYGRFVGDAIRSAINQDFSGSFEIIVVNDGSSDNSDDVIKEFGTSVRYIKHSSNMGVAVARNTGVSAARGRYVSCLDADDMYLPHYLKTLVPALDSSRSIGIVYGALEMLTDNRKMMSQWPPDYDFQQSATRHNCVPSASLFRKEAWRRVGGYRQKYSPAEDAEFFLRVAAIGYKVAKASKSAVYTYRLHGDSLSRKIKEPEWCADKSYWINTPFAAGGSTYPVRDYDQPWVAIVVPVGPRHIHDVHKAIDSVLHQTMPYWELIVVNDSGMELIMPSTGVPLKDVYPFVKFLVADKHANPAAARNQGAIAAKSDFLVFLDADDWLEPSFLMQTINAYNEDPSKYVYTDYYGISSDSVTEHRSKDYDASRMYQEALHPISALVPKVWHDEIGGFDEELLGWEDWDYYLKMAVAKHYGNRVEECLFIYDYSSGHRREESLSIKAKLLSYFENKYKELEMCVTCGSAKVRKTMPKADRPINRGESLRLGAQAMQDGMIEVRENSGNRGAHGVTGVRTKHHYGRHSTGDQFMMYAQDQMAQPHLYVLVNQPAQQDIPVAIRPIAPSVPITSSAPKPVVSVVQSVAPVMPPAAVPEVDDDSYELDISMLKLSQIRNLNLDPDTAADAVEAERAGLGRGDVIAYLESLTLTGVVERGNKKLTVELSDKELASRAG